MVRLLGSLRASGLAYVTCSEPDVGPPFRIGRPEYGASQDSQEDVPLATPRVRPTPRMQLQQDSYSTASSEQVH